MDFFYGILIYFFVLPLQALCFKEYQLNYLGILTVSRL